ncbi:MAG: fluoride efflux transporter CrcB [Bacteroidota bacterium]
MRSVLLVALSGAVGAVARYGIGLASVRWAEAGWPVGTWIVNAVGCLLIGLALPLVEAERTRLILLVGVLGSFTTFSTFSADTVVLWEAGRPGLAVANAVGSVAVGLVFVLIGVSVGRHLGAAAG